MIGAHLLLQPSYLCSYSVPAAAEGEERVHDVQLHSFSNVSANLEKKIVNLWSLVLLLVATVQSFFNVLAFLIYRDILLFHFIPVLYSRKIASWTQRTQTYRAMNQKREWRGYGRGFKAMLGFAGTLAASVHVIATEESFAKVQVASQWPDPRRCWELRVVLYLYAESVR